MWRLMLQALLICLLWLCTFCHSFTCPDNFPTTKHREQYNSPRHASGSLFFFNTFFGTPTKDDTTTNEETLNELRKEVEEMIVSSQGKAPVQTLEPFFSGMEAQNTYDEPNRSPLYKGKWHVWYTDCPPPSNGKLGPFQGSAEQNIDPYGGNAYNNILRLPPNSADDEWLTVILNGIWEDWDGKELQNDNSAAVRSDDNNESRKTRDQDWGAKFWKVTFLRLKFILFGNELISKDFPPDTARVWRTTFLDETTRLVRAGRTGRMDDESVFYMKRSPRPSS